MYGTNGIDVVGPRMCRTPMSTHTRCMYKTLYPICNHIALDILDIQMDSESVVTNLWGSITMSRRGIFVELEINLYWNINVYGIKHKQSKNIILESFYIIFSVGIEAVDI